MFTPFYQLVFITAFFCIQAHGNHSSLVENSPFGPPNKKQEISLLAATPKQPEVPNDKFTLKGIAIIGNEYLFSIYDGTNEQTEWLSPNETINGFTVRSYDPEKLIVYYEWNGTKGSTQLKTPDDKWVKLNFLDNKKAQENRSNPNVNKNIDSYHSSNNQSSSNTHTGLEAYEQIRTAKKIIFSSYGSSTDNTDKNIGFSSGRNSFASTDSDSSDSSTETQSIEVVNTATSVPTSRYKVKRINRVHNAGGKMP